MKLNLRVENIDNSTDGLSLISAVAVQQLPENVEDYFAGIEPAQASLHICITNPALRGAFAEDDILSVTVEKF